MSKMEYGRTIPTSGQECPGNEAIPTEAGLDDSGQEVDAESVMSLEIALVRALQQLGKAPEEN